MGLDTDAEINKKKKKLYENKLLKFLEDNNYSQEIF